MTKTNPDRTFETAVRNKKQAIQLMWEIHGPKNTQVAWISCYAILADKQTSIIMVQTFQGGGWEIYTHANTNMIDETLADAFQRCGI